MPVSLKPVSAMQGKRLNLVTERRPWRRRCGGVSGNFVGAVGLVCSGIAKNAKNACAKSLGTVHDVYNEGEPSVGLFV